MGRGPIKARAFRVHGRTVWLRPARRVIVDPPAERFSGRSGMTLARVEWLWRYVLLGLGIYERERQS